MALVIPLVALACLDPVVDPTSLVTEPRTLAVAVNPAEVEPGAEVTLTSLYADRSGPLATAPIDWSFCTALKPLAELGPVARTCLDPSSDALSPIGEGLEVTALVPDDACSRFGPNPPPADAGEPPGRPTDPDPTGGFYQPALAFDPAITLVPVRVRCGLAATTQEVSVAWNLGYHSNQAPTVSALTVDPAPVAAGDHVSVTVSWPECPAEPLCGDGMCTLGEDLGSCADDCATPVGCGGAEGYLLYDAASHALVPRREALSATWFATAGSFDRPRDGQPDDSDQVDVTNGWQAPDDAGDVWLGVVLRDDRG
ncbi:MAG: hypothetical protein ABMB14_25690, partial [Myxococcota bacterium]